MDRKEKRSLNRRLLGIYICYFVILGVGFMHSFAPVFSSAFSEGWNRATRDIELERQGIEHKSMLFSVRPSVFGGWVGLESDFEHIGLRANVCEALVDVEVSDCTKADSDTVALLTRSYNRTTYIEFARMFAWLAILILSACIINSLRKSIRDGRTLADSNITLTRIIGILIIAAELLSAWELHTGHTAVGEIMRAGTTLSVESTFPVDYSNLVFGLLVIFAAEVFAIGTRLSEEQEYTI